MSKGSERVTLRIGDDRRRAIESAIDASARHTAGEPLNLSSWILRAIDESLGKVDRAKRSRERRRAAKKGGTA